MSSSVESVGQSLTSTSTVNQSVADNSALDKDAFLEILVAELANQDPMDPVDQTEFIAQMAQFTEVEQMTNMNGTLDSMSDLMSFSAATMVGSDITYADEDGVNVTATVDSVVFEQGQVLVAMDNGDQVSIDRVISIG